MSVRIMGNGVSNKSQIAIAGASGFIGKSLMDELLQETDVHVVALSRRPQVPEHDRVSCRAVDFFSLYQAEQALQGCDVAVYLLHSMSPSNGLSQGSFDDFDFILADNFARAAKRAGVQQIIYVGGMIASETSELSRHLRSRLEVEHTLGCYGVPLTSLRCSLVIGEEGSSFLILKKLVERLPLMFLPKWCGTKCQPIALEDVLCVLRKCIRSPEALGRSFDLGTPEILTYRELIEMTVEASGLRRRLVDVPSVPLFLSKLWVMLVTGASKSLVYPLVDSLNHAMTVREGHEIPEDYVPVYIPIREALRRAMRRKEEGRVRFNPPPRRRVREEKLVKSVQRLRRPLGTDAYTVARLYFKWLSWFFNGIINVHLEGQTASFRLFGLKAPILVLTLSLNRSAKDRQLFYITGGLLVTPHERARLEFRESPVGDDLFAAIHDFRPSLPWWLYRLTQAPFHRFVMWSFGRFLNRLHLRKVSLSGERDFLPDLMENP